MLLKGTNQYDVVGKHLMLSVKIRVKEKNCGHQRITIGGNKKCK